MKFRKSYFLLPAVLLLLIALPILFSSSPLPLCPLAVSAQDNPCLAQDATISALEFNNLQLQLTADSAATVIASGGMVAPPIEIEVTVIVIVTATPSEFDSTDASPPAESSAETTPPEGAPALEPTIESAQVAIVEISGVGDLDSEGVTLRNDGASVNLSGWTLTDGEGNLYIFPDYEFFPNAQVTLFTRAGEDSPFALYWGLEQPAWTSGKILTLRDSNGGVQANQLIGGDAPTIAATPDAPAADAPPTSAAEVTTVTNTVLLLSYDARTLMLRNIGASNQDVRTLVFRRTDSAGTEYVFTASEWPNPNRLTAFRPGDCFQVYTNIVSVVPYVEDELNCGFLQAFRQIPPAKWFWISRDAAGTFDVLRNGAVVATCVTVLPDRQDGVWQECGIP